VRPVAVSARAESRTPTRLERARPRLELSGPKLAQALEGLVARSEEHGGIERYVEALRLKSAMVREALADGKARSVELGTFKALCALMTPVRRRIGSHLASPAFEHLRGELARLLEGLEDTTTTDRRLAAFCAAFPADRQHRWVRDLAAESLHNVDPERYPLMCRWVWDADTRTGVVREIWHAAEGDYADIEVADGYDTFVVLREELAQFLSANGVFRDVVYYVDLLVAHVYAGYVSEQGGAYLRADFNAPEDPMHHTRRLLGLDGVDARGRTRLKSVDGEAFVVEDLKLLD
jgi:hypothetical protein